MTAAPRLGAGVVWAAIVVLVAAFAAAPVLLSHDVYSYLDYARLGAVHGLDPYVEPPLAAPADPAFAHVAWTESTSAYGPLFTLATYPLAWLPVGLAIAALKAAAALSVLGLAAIVARLAAWRGVEPLRAAAFVALNPLVLVHVVGGAHNDGLAMLLAMLAVAAVLSAREATGGAALDRGDGNQGLRPRPGPLRPPRRRKPGVDGPQASIWQTFQAHRPAVGRGLAWRPVGSAARPISASAGTGCAPSGWPGENQGRTSHMSIPITTARLTGLDPDATRAAALVLFAAASPTCCSGPGAAATGSAPPPGPPPASSSPPPGSSPGTWSGPSPSPRSPATAPSSSSPSPLPPTN